MRDLIKKIKKSIVMLGTLSVILSGTALAEDALGYEKIELLIGSSVALLDGVYSTVDENDESVMPQIVEDRTLVPVRFISENFGMEVAYEATERRVSLTRPGLAVEIVLDRAEYTVNGEERYFDVPATIINERTFLPLRALTELIGKNVYYKDGYIYIGTEEFSGDVDLIKEHMEKGITDGGEYGVRFRVIKENADYYDSECERLAESEMMSAVAERPGRKGRSDFDKVAPWKDMKLCSVVNDNGKSRVIYSDDAEFDRYSQDVFVEIPKFYYKRYIENGYEYRYISSEPKEGYSVDPSFMENGKEIDFIYVSAYEGTDVNGKLGSVSGYYPMTEKTKKQYTDLAKNKGNGYANFDIRTLMTLQNLYLVEYARKNSQEAVGEGWAMCLPATKRYSSVKNEENTNKITIKNNDDALKSRLFVGSSLIITDDVNLRIIHQRTITNLEITDDFITISFDGEPINITTRMCIGSGGQKSGWTDSMSYHTGRAEGNGYSGNAEYRAGIKYRNIENLWGNMWHNIDGININFGKVRFGSNIAGYNADGNKYTTVNIQPLQQLENGNSGGINEIHYMKNLGYDSNHPWLALPEEYMYITETTIEGESAKLRNASFGDYYYFKSNIENGIYVHGGGLDHYWRSGLFTLRAWDDVKKSSYMIGTRLIYKNL